VLWAISNFTCCESMGRKIEQQAVLPVFFVPMTRKPGAEDRP